MPGILAYLIAGSIATEPVILVILCAILFILFISLFGILMTKHRRSYFNINSMLPAFKDSLIEKITKDLQEMITKHYVQPEDAVTAAPPDISVAQAPSVSRVPVPDWTSASSSTESILFGPQLAARLPPLAPPTIMPAPVQRILDITWQFNNAPINYKEGEFSPVIFPLYGIEPLFGHFIYWDQTALEQSSTKNPNGEQLLKIFKKLVIGGQGIVRYYAMEAEFAMFKVKSLSKQFSANTHRVFCNEIARVIVDGKNRILYRAYTIKQTHN